MSDLPISELPEATTPISTDLMAIVVDNATIPVTKKITYSNLEANIFSTPADSILSGLDADKSGTPSVGDVYYATDTKKLYLCDAVDVWTGLVGVCASDNLKQSADTQRNTNSSNWTLRKEIQINYSGVIRVKFDLCRDNVNNVFQGQIYINGAGVGRVREGLTTWTTFTEDIRIGSGDRVQLYLKSDGSNRIYCRNFRIYYDKVTVDDTILTKD